MMLRKMMLLACACLLLAVSAARAEADAAQPLPADASIDQILQALHARGDGLRDFAASVAMEDVDNTTGNEVKRTGRIWYQRLDDGKVRMRIVFERKIVEGRVLPEKIEYLLKDGWLTDRDYASKIEVNRQVLRPGQQIDLLKLGEGPFPLPIGQDPAEVRRQFDIEQREPGNDAPENTLHVQLTPKPGTDLARRFSTLDFWIDRDSHMPILIETMDQNMASTQTTRLTDLRVNAGIDDSQFVLEDISDKGWTRRDEPFDR